MHYEKCTSKRNAFCAVIMWIATVTYPFSELEVCQNAFAAEALPLSAGRTYTGWAKKTGLFLEVCTSRIC